MELPINQILQGDCLEIMKSFPDKSIDLVITDPPYGITDCSWDTVIPFTEMWKEFLRIGKENCAFVIFGSQPFTSNLILSKPDIFRYEII